MSRKWLAWIGMILGAAIFAAADGYAASMEHGKRITTSSWIRYGIRRWPIVAVVGLAIILWHFVLEAFYPGLPL